MKKKCSQCDKVKDIEAFSRNWDKKWGKYRRRSACKKCSNEKEDNSYASRKEYLKLYYRTHRREIKARWQVWKALKKGKLHKRPCEFALCQRKKVEAHHSDYEKPLEVIWLCKIHHALLDYPNKK